MLAAAAAVVVLAGSPDAGAPANDAMLRALGAASCTSEYADAIFALAPRFRELERAPQATYSYCVRNTATYECLRYDDDGKLKRRKVTSTSHGTAFAYQEKNGETFLLTNDHVATSPLVSHETDVIGVPPGCKKIDDQLRLVRDQYDAYEPGQIAVTKVVNDLGLDAAVIKVRQKLNLMPYRLGSSALLRAGNIVLVKGFPLGLMEATNYGKVVSPLDRDHQGSWDHADFVIDALVTEGNSGSPVLAISCRTGELELVGLYHAGYRGSPALNVAIAVDELKEFMETFKRTLKPTVSALDASSLQRVVAALSAQGPIFFPVGDRVARARIEGGQVIYEIFNERFPVRSGPSATLWETAADAGTGLLTELELRAGDELRRSTVDATDAETQDLARRLVELVRRQLALTLEYREADAVSAGSREAFRRSNELQTLLSARRAEANEVMRAVGEVASRLPKKNPVATAPPAPPPAR